MLLSASYFGLVLLRHFFPSFANGWIFVYSLSLFFVGAVLLLDTLATRRGARPRGTVTILAGSTTGQITVAVSGDTLYEADETFTVNLSSPGNATIAVGTGTGTILNDDLPPTLSIGNISLLEGNSGTTNFIFTVTQSAISGLNSSVAFSGAGSWLRLAVSSALRARSAITVSPNENTLIPIPTSTLHSSGENAGSISRPTMPMNPSTPSPTIHPLWLF